MAKKKGKTRGAKPGATPPVQFRETVERTLTAIEGVRDQIQKAVEDQKEQKAREERMGAILEACLKMARDFPDERRKLIVRGSGESISNLAAGIIYAGMREDYNAALVLSEVLFAQGYEAAMNAPDPKFRNLE
jgi:hypothetical protein